MSTEKDKNATHALLYTDGGFRSSWGMGGWGVHGYLYHEEPAKQGAGAKNAVPSRTGYQMGKGGKPDITVVEYVDGYGTLPGDTTNNRAELMAFIKALGVVREAGVEHAHFVMDSKYVLEGANQYLPGWKKRNWTKADGKDVSNRDLWEEIDGLLEGLKAMSVKVEYTWIKGHSGDLGNDSADTQATRAMIAGMNRQGGEEIKRTGAKGYWKFDHEPNRMFSHPQWYFTLNADDRKVSDCGRHIYYLGDPRDDEELFGKPIAAATYSILYLKEPDPALERVRDRLAGMINPTMQGLVMAYRSKIFKPEIYSELKEYGDRFLTCDVNKGRVFQGDPQSPDVTLLAREIRPVGLAYNAMAALNSLERMLQAYLDPTNAPNVRQTDLTDLLYERTDGKKPVVKLKPHISSSLRSLDVEANYATIENETAQTKLRLTLALDTPDRNMLAAVAGEATKVVLLTWPESPVALRYAIVVEADGDVGIWSGIYANLHMLTS